MENSTKKFLKKSRIRFALSALSSQHIKSVCRYYYYYHHFMALCLGLPVCQ